MSDVNYFCNTCPERKCVLTLTGKEKKQQPVPPTLCPYGGYKADWTT
jgi:hypothetical protein